MRYAARPHHAGVNSGVRKVSKVLASILALLPGLLAPAASDAPSAEPVSLTVNRCGEPEREIRFGMLAPDEEPDLQASYGLPVCLAVFRETDYTRR